MSTATRRSTRRTAASAEPAQPASVQSAQQATLAPELLKKKARKTKATSAQLESQTVMESQQTVTKTRATPRANVTPATTTTTSTTSTTTTQVQVPAAVGRTTRNRKAAAAANGVASPLRSLGEKPKPVKRQGRGTARQQLANEQSKPVQAESSADDENDEDEAPFFSMSKIHISSIPPIDSEYPVLRKKNDTLRGRVTDLEAYNARLKDLVQIKGRDISSLEYDIVKLKREIERKDEINFRLTESNGDLERRLALYEPWAPGVSSGSTPRNTSLEEFANNFSSPFARSLFQSTPRQPTNTDYTEFDSEMLETTQAEPEFVNGSESALALLHRIENNAKGPARLHSSSINDSETIIDNGVTMENTPQQSAKRTFTEASATPERPAAKNPSFLSRSFSAITSRFFTTPKAPSTSTPDVVATAPPKPLPARDTFTESLSVPPTPIGERVKTPTKRRTATSNMMRVLLKGVDDGEKHKAEVWAKQIIPELKNDPAFREKRKRLEKTVLFKDLTHFPSAKPWEAGFGDPLGDLDDDDAVPGWAIYLNMKAEEEEHQPKKHKKNHDFTTRDDEIPSLNEQFAASNSAGTAPKLYNSHGQSASLYDFHPRRAIDPSPMFVTSVSHNEGNNLFNELHTNDTAAQIRESDREVLKNMTKETVHTHHNPGMGSFSVPDDSDDDDIPAENETSDTEATPLWTQPPPPAPVPAHAPLPGGHVADSPAAPPTPQPEIERQRQRLMKHTPAKPSRLREATYPSPSLFSEAGTNSPLVATSTQLPPDFASMFSDMPGAEIIELDEEEQAAFDEIVNTDEYKKLLTAKDWPVATLSYESDEEDLSPISAQGFDNA
jgi:hypothetical protein